MTLGEAITKYVDLKQSMGMRFQNEHRILRAFHRQVGDVRVAEVSPEAVATFLAGRGPITATWLNKHRALRGFYRHRITRGQIKHTPVPPTRSDRARGRRRPRSCLPPTPGGRRRL